MRDLILNPTKKFQIQFVNSDGDGRFEYFTVDSTVDIEVIKKEAELVANNFLAKMRENDSNMLGNFFHQPYKPPKSVKVVEYDNKRGNFQGTIRGGIKFKLSLGYMELTFGNGTKKRNEWYEVKR